MASVLLKGYFLLEQVQHTATKVVSGLENMTYEMNRDYMF